MNFKMATLNTIKGWSENDVLTFLDKNNLSNYKAFATTKGIDGYKLLSLSEGIIALWRPKLDPKKLLSAVNDLKSSNIQSISNQIEKINYSNTDKIDKSNETSYKRVKPKIPIRKDSLKNVNDSIQSEKSFMVKNTNSEKIVTFCNNSDSVTNHMDFNKMVAPQSFLYSETLKKVATKVNPYAPMGTIIIEKNNTPQSSSNNENDTDETCLPESITMANIEDGNYMTIMSDRGYYEMNSNRKSSASNEYWDINVDFDKNTYEELLFKIKNLNDSEIRKKKKGIIDRVLRRPVIKKDKKEDKVSQSTDSTEIFLDKNFDNVNNFQRLQMINDRVTKRFYSPQTNNYQVSATNVSDEVTQIDKYEQIPDYEVLESIKQDNAIKTTETIIEETADTKNKIMTDNFIATQRFFMENDFEFYEEPPNILSNDLFYNMDLNVLNENVYESAETIEEEQNNVEKIRDQDEPTIDVEDYLEPRKIIGHREEHVMDTLADEILKLFDNNMESRIQKKDTTSAIPNKDNSICSEIIEISSKECEADVITPVIQKPPTPKKPLYLPKPLPRRKLPSYPDSTPKKNSSNIDDSSKPMLSYSTGNMDRKPPSLSSINMSQNIGQSDDVTIHRPFEKLQKWNETLRNSIRKKRDNVKTNMAERPLPVPVENEFYYMDVSRQYAEKLLEGHADGTFILRPSSQSLHAYTVTLIYHDRIYNIGCRRRQDGRLALGFTKASEQSFLTINDLIEHYYHEKLVLLVDGMNVGSTVLKKLNA